MKTKKLVAAAAIAATLCVTIGGTLAWLTDTTDPVKNTFTVGNVEIELAETKDNFKMVPGGTIEKDPKVTVEAESEDCYVFVKVEESNNLESYIGYTIDSGWTALPEVDGVYYRVVEDIVADQTFSVLADDEVSVLEAVTSDMMDAVSGDNAGNAPTLTFTAYAVQKANVTDVNAAWNIVNPASANE